MMPLPGVLSRMRASSASFTCWFTVRRTSKRRFGRAKPVIVMYGSRIPSCRAMSLRTVSVAVAVSARIGRAAESLGDGAEDEVVGAEVVPPLAHAVRLVDDEEADLAREQALEKIAILEALRREIEDLAGAVFHFLLRVARLRRGEMRVHCERIDAVRGELVLLVLHERDERADDHRQPGEHERGKLVDERLAAAGGHDDERIAACEQRLDRLPLSFLKILVPEPLDQHTSSGVA